jgi:ABC-type sugar transport system ATPase subunit
MSSLEIANLTKTFPDGEAIRGVTLSVASGEFVVLVGPSGCGKSTILRMIAGLESVTSGSIRIDDEDVTSKPAARRGTAMVFQSYALYPHMTVRQNLSFGLRNMKYPKAEIASRVAKAAQTLQLDALLDRMPHQLSGGQRQRVAIGRSIVRDPKIFLFDEPLSNLDTELRVKMRHELARLHRQLKSTMIYVTHDQVEAMTLADRIVVVNKGRIEQTGSPLDLYNWPSNVFAAGFIGSPAINLLPAHLVALQDGNLIVEMSCGETVAIASASCGLNVGDLLTLGIRPEHASLLPVDHGLELELAIDAVEELGHSTLVYGLHGKDQEFRVKLDGHHDLQSLDRLKVYVRHADIKIFDEGGTAVQPLKPA